MANIQPQSEIRFYTNVPLDRSYKNCLYMGDPLIPSTYDPYHSCTDKLLSELGVVGRYITTETNYTYLREELPVVKVAIPAGRIRDCSYIAFKNPPMGSQYQVDKWYFAFVDTIEYINNETTRVSFTIDVMTTWWEEHHLNPSFIERCHSTTDGFGDNLVPENFGFGDYKYAVKDNNIVHAYLFNMRPSWTVVPVSYESFGDETDPSTWDDTKDILSYDGLVSGYKLFFFDTDQILVAGSTAQALFNRFMDRFGAKNNAEGILGIFEMPKYLVSSEDIHTGSAGSIIADYPYLVGHDNITQEKTLTGYTLDYQTTLDGYTPVNMKMYTAPFCTCQVSMPDGQEMILRHEYFTPTQGGSLFSVTPQFRLNFSVFPPLSMILRPKKGYGCLSGAGNAPEDYNYMLEYKDSPQGSWSYGVFKTWMQQKFVPSLVNAGFSLLGLGSFIKLSSNSSSHATSVTSRETASGKILHSTRSYESEGVRESNAMAVTGAREIKNSMLETYSWFTQPPASTRVVDSNALYANNKQVLEVKCLCINHDDAERIDKFFSAYGYAQKQFMQPYRMTRYRWTYIELVNPMVYGNLDDYNKTELQNIYAEGVTFWSHLDVLGVYDFSRGANNVLPSPMK